MEGNITQIGPSKWEVRITEWVPDLSKGTSKKRRSQIRRRFNTEAEATEFWRAENARMGSADGTIPNTLGEYLDYWFATSGRRRWLGSTARANRSHLDQVIAEIGDVRMCDLKRHHFVKFVNDLADRGLQPTSISRKIAPLRTAMLEALDADYVTKDLTARLPIGRQPRKEAVATTPEENDAFERAAFEVSHNFGVMVALDVLTGIRRAEILALRWSDVDLDAGVLTVRRAVSTDYDGNIIVKSTKTNTVRKIALGPDGVELLRAHREVTRRLAEEHTVVHLDQYLFVKHPLDDTVYRPDYITKTIRKIRERLGLRPEVSIKSIRHYQATMLLSSGIGLPDVAGRMGHAGGGATTVRVYGHAIAERDIDSALIIEAKRREGRTG